MTIIGSKSTWKVSNAATRAERGPLVRVKVGPGHWRNMRTQDAIDAGYIKGKVARTPEDKMASGPENKSAIADDLPPEDFTVIEGVGKATARSLVAQGIRTLDQLRAVRLEDLRLSKAALVSIEAWRG